MRNLYCILIFVYAFCLILYHKAMLMKIRPGKSIVFIGKSILWSLLLYTVMMLAFNWEEVNSTLKGHNAVTIESVPASPLDPYIHPASIAIRKSGFGTVINLIRNISGFVTAAVPQAMYH